MKAISEVVIFKSSLKGWEGTSSTKNNKNKNKQISGEDYSSQREEFVQRSWGRKKLGGGVWGTEGKPGSWSVSSEGETDRRLDWEEREGTGSGRARPAMGKCLHFFFKFTRSHRKVLTRRSMWSDLCFKKTTLASSLNFSVSPFPLLKIAIKLLIPYPFEWSFECLIILP